MPTPRVSPAAVGSVLLAAAAFGLILAGHLSGGGALDLPWAPALGLRLHFELDGLGALYGLLATGIGLVVFAYAAVYLPEHLRAHGRPQRDGVAFFGALTLFMVSMVGLVTAQDLLLLFVFWDLTAIASYLLIGFDRDEATSRRAALMALLVTGISAVLLLIGALLLAAEYGTFSLPEIIERARPGGGLTLACALIAAAGLAKSAQVPLHFWLPRAMAAPTPVSAYLHSAAMVAAGVFLLGRFYPLLRQSPEVLDGLLVVGLASIAVGGVIALTRDTLKQVLAYSTISQYGYVVTTLGLGGRKAALAASFYVIAHALAKCALFLTAGAVTQTTGAKGLSGIRGMAREAPVLAAASGVAAAGLAALPLTVGFFKDELFFAAALERGTVWAILATAAAALTFAYIARFWSGIFLGSASSNVARPGAGLTAPVVVLALLVVAGGLTVSPFLDLAKDAGAATYGMSTPGEAAYHLDLRAENVMALTAYASGAFLLAVPAVWRPLALGVARAGEAAGPARAYQVALTSLNRLSDAVHTFEVRDLRNRLRPILIMAGLLVALGIVSTPSGAYVVGSFTWGDLPLALTLIVAACAAIACTVPRDHLKLVLTLSALGFSLAVAYAFFAAPDVALVAVLVETVFGLLFFGVFSLLPREILRNEAVKMAPPRRRRGNVALASVSGTFAFVVVWGALSRPAGDPSAATELTARTPDAHAKDIVTAILADFRGLDTLVEITVVLVAVLAMATLLRRGRLT